jgi:hypothetical protein
MQANEDWSKSLVGLGRMANLPDAHPSGWSLGWSSTLPEVAAL